jgi:hypothetical protein
MTLEYAGELRLFGPDIEDNSVAAEVLVRVLTGLQEAAYVIGAAAEGKGIGERFKPSAELRQRCQIRCGVQRAGSYAMSYWVGPQLVQPALFPVVDPVAERLYQLAASVTLGSYEAAAEVLPDSRARNLALRKLQGAMPKVGERWSLGMSLGSMPEIRLDASVARSAERLVQLPDEPDAVMTVTGELIGINFSEYKILLRYPPTGREIECVYLPEIEDTLVDSRRDHVQVTGRYILDQDGSPRKLTDVSRIEVVDLSPLTFETVVRGKMTLLIAPPLTVTPHLDEDSKQLYEVSDESLNLFASSYTRSELADEVAEQLCVLWGEYAQELDERLTPKAQLLRAHLRSRLQETA